MPEPIVTLGLELCSGYGTSAEQTPRMTIGSVSMCVWSSVSMDGTCITPPQNLHSSVTFPSSPGFRHSTSISDRNFPQCSHFCGVL